MSTCKYCGKDGLEWQVNIGKFVNPISGQHHGYSECVAQPIKLLEVFNGIVCYRREDSIAFAITQEALRLKLDPFTVKTERKGDELFVIR